MPYLGSTVFFVTCALGLALAMTGCWLLVRALAPRFALGARERWRSRPVLTVLLGAVVGGFLTIAAAALASSGLPAGGLLGAILLLATLSLGIAGSAGLAGLVGEGLASPSDAGRAWFQTLKGGLALELSFLLPVLGWLVLLPVALYGGVGASLGAIALGLARRLRGERHVEVADARAS